MVNINEVHMFSMMLMILKMSTLGFAFTGALCQANSQSIVEDKFNFGILTVAAHELGHR